MRNKKLIIGLVLIAMCVVTAHLVYGKSSDSKLFNVTYKVQYNSITLLTASILESCFREEHAAGELDIDVQPVGYVNYFTAADPPVDIVNAEKMKEFKVVFSVEYDSLSLEKASDLEKEFRKLHSDACMVDVVVAEMGQSGSFYFSPYRISDGIIIPN